MSDSSAWDGRAARHDLHAVFTERWSPSECARVDQTQRDVIAAHLPSGNVARVLDLGCGIGRLTGWLAGQLHADEVIGVDYSPAMLRRAAAESTHPKVSFERASATNLPFADATFDVIVTVAVLQHLVEPTEFATACKEIGRTLSRGGTLVCLEGINPNGDSDATAAATATATATRRRSIAEYNACLGADFNLVGAQTIACIEDAYTVLCWTRQGGGRH